MATEILHENNGYGIRVMRTKWMRTTASQTTIGKTRTPTSRPQSRTPMTTLTSTIPWRTCTEFARTAHLFHSCDCLTLHIPWLKFSAHFHTSIYGHQHGALSLTRPLPSSFTFSSCPSPSSSSTPSCSLSSTTRSSWQVCATPLQKRVRTPRTSSISPTQTWSRNPDESHGYEERQICTLQKRLPIPFYIVFNSDSQLVFSLRSKQRFRKAHLEAARWVLRTSFARQSVAHQFPVTGILAPQSTVSHQFFVARILTTWPQRTDWMRHVQGSDMHQRFLLFLVKSR